MKEEEKEKNEIKKQLGFCCLDLHGRLGIERSGKIERRMVKEELCDTRLLHIGGWDI